MLGIILGVWQKSSVNAGGTDLPSQAIRKVVDPLAVGVDNVSSAIGNFTSGIINSSHLTAENARLKQLAQAAEMYDARLSELQNEVNSLQQLLAMPAMGNKQRVPARIIGVFPNEYRASINVGTSDGITPGMPVVAAPGYVDAQPSLLGVVQTCDRHKSQIQLVWSPPPFKMGAIVSRPPFAAGLLHGEDWNRLILELGTDASVTTNDLVSTSGFSEKIPRGIPIGRVVQTTHDREFGVVRAQVFPNIQIGEVQEVVVLK